VKKFVLILSVLLLASPVLAQPGGHGHGPGGGRPPLAGHVSAGHRPPMHNYGHRPPMHRPPIHHISHRPPMPPIRPHYYYRPYRPYRPLVVPYYSSFYYPVSSYYVPSVRTTTTYITNDGVQETVVVNEDTSPYAGINTAANVINAAANAATAIRFLTW